MKVLMLPDKFNVASGIGQVIENYKRWLPQVGVELVNTDYDLSASHLGYKPDADIFFSHGFWWGDVSPQMREQNQLLAQSANNAKAVICPSEYVARIFRRDFRINPFVIGHGVNVEEWQHKYKSQGYILWNKNRNADVCNPQAVVELAKRFPDLPFVTTFSNEDLPNVKVTGRLPFNKMKPTIQKAGVYLSTAKETFCIGILEALASNVPVLAFEWGNVGEIITHKKDGYLVKPNDYDALADGLEWLLSHKLNCVETAKQYSWLDVVTKIKGVFEYAKSI